MASVQGLKDKTSIDARRAHDVLKHLDALKPVLQLDFNYVKLVYERLTKSKPAHILLNYYDVLVTDVLKIFPNQATIMKNLIQIYQFHKPHAEKSKLLFAMYNINQTGLMDEMEHVNFILRITECMKKLKLMGVLDITAPDAKFIALEARVKHENNQITFVPGLYVADFTRWVQTSKECQTLFKFTKVLSRLVDSLHALENRANALLSIMEAKNEYEPDAYFVPPLDLFKQCVSTNASIYVVYRSQTQVSISIPLADLQESDVYIKLDKLDPCVHKRYEIPRSILKRNVDVWKANKAPELECCKKGILLTSYRSQYVDSSTRQRDQVPFQRVDVSNLEPSSVYYVTVYTRSVQYRTLKVHTMARSESTAGTMKSRKNRGSLNSHGGSVEGKDEAEGKGEDSEEENADAEEATQHSSAEGSLVKGLPPASTGAEPRVPHSVCILPASLSAQEAEAVCKRHGVGAASTVVFTGTVCSIQQGLKDCVPFLVDKEATMEFSTRLASSLGTFTSAEYAALWQRCLGTLAGIAQCEAPISNIYELVAAVENQQVMYYDGAGPWDSVELLRCLQEAFGEKTFGPFRRHIEALYRRYSATIAPPAPSISDEHAQLYFVRHDKPPHSASTSTITLSDLTELLFAQIKQHDDLNSSPKHLILLVRSPVDLLGDMDASSASAAEVAQRASAATKLRTAAQSDLLRKDGSTAAPSAVPRPKLTGRHELLHGEYSNTIPSANPPDVDQYSYFLSSLEEETGTSDANRNPADVSSTFNTFLHVASKWLQGGQRSTDFDLDWKTSGNERKMTIVSCNWDNGENFEIKFDPSGVIIRHENLLPTRSYVPPPEDNPLMLDTVFEDASSTAMSSPSRPYSRGVGSPGMLTTASSVTSFAPLVSTRSSKFSSSFQDKESSEETKETNSRAPSRVGSRRKMDTPVEFVEPPPPEKSAFEKSSALAASLKATEDALRRLNASLPRSTVLEVGLATPLRAVHCPASRSGSGESRQCVFTPVAKYLKQGEPWWRTSLLQSDVELEVASSAEVAFGPHVARVTGTSASITVGVVGCGRVSCTVYEVPVHIQYDDIVSVVSTVDRAKLRTVAVKSQYCTAERELVFNFDNLTAFCCYCVVVDPYKEIPAVSCFRTLGLPNRKVDTIMLCPMSAEDVRSPSVRLGRLAHFTSISRNPASAVYCMDYDAAVMQNNVGEHLRHRADLNFTQKSNNVRHAASAEDKNLHSALPFIVNNPHAETLQETDSVHVSTQGHFCYISTQNEGAASLRKVIQAVRTLRMEPDVHLLVLLVNQPLVRYLRLHSDGQFVCDGPISQHKPLLSLLFLCLLDWKSRDESNDCKIICTAPVSTPKCVMIRHAVHEGSSYHRDDRHDDLSINTLNMPSYLLPEEPAPAVIVGIDTTVENLLDAHSWLEDTTGVDNSYLNSVDFNSVVQEQTHPELHRQDSLDSHKKFQNLDSVFESINDRSVSDQQLQVKIANALAENSMDESPRGDRQDRYMQDRDVLAGRAGYVSLEHLILPIDHHAVENEEVDESITLPEGKCLVGNIIEYEVLHEFSAEETGVHQVTPRLELYKESIGPESKVQPVVYQLEFFIRCVKPKEEQASSVVDDSIISAMISANALHRVYVRPLINEHDLVEMILGPVFGRVSTDSVLALFEFNMNLRQLSCVLQPLGAQDENEFVYRIIENIKAFELIEINFSDLLPGTFYEVFLPELFGTKAIGKFKTIQPFLAFAQIAVAGSNTLKDHPILPVIVEQLQYQQSPNLAEIRLLNEIIAEDEKMKRNVPTYPMESCGGYDNTWAKLGAHLATPGVHTAAVFHIGGVSALSHYWFGLVGAMIMHARRLEIPLREASTVGQWYFKQIEQVVKDTFRLFWSTPVVQEVLSHASNIPIYQAQYLLPLSVMDDQVEAARIAGSEEDTMLLQLVRRVFESHLQAYLSRLYGFEPGASHHYIAWRSNSMVTIGLDNASGRRKMKKKGGVDGDEEEEGGEAGADPTVSSAQAGKSASVKSKLTAEKGSKDDKVDMKDPFSFGFIDRAQWKNIRALVLDRTITHVVILTEKPILSLGHLSRDFKTPESVPKGEVLEWSPTAQDLEIFLKFWFDWLAMFQNGEVSSCRSVQLISTCKVPYSTLIQDLKTGLKIQQMCVGEYDAGLVPPVLPLRMKDISMSGKLGTIRYVHQLDGQDYLMTQSTGIERNSTFIERNATAQGEAAGPVVLARSAGFATLRLWFDSWKALGIWAQESPDAAMMATQQSDATLLVGPMLGAPVLYTSAEDTDTAKPSSHFKVAMLIEVDRPTSVVLVATSLFTDHVLRVEMKELTPRRPYVLDIGPLEPEGRYNVKLVSGLKPSPYNTFVIDTFIHENETNIMALNCAPVVGEVAGSQIIIEAALRCSVPFCGITAALHTNFQPNFDRVINEFRYSNSLMDELKEARRIGHLSPAFRIHLENIIEVFRDQYRTVLSKPSYAELLRNGFNLMMQNFSAGFKDDVEADEGSDLYQISSLVVLIIARLNQEYFDHWMSPHLNVFRAMQLAKGKPDTTLDNLLLDGAGSPPVAAKAPQGGEKTPATPKSRPGSAKVANHTLEWSDPSDAAVDCIFQQWYTHCKPAPYKWHPWVSPNGKTSIEQIYSVNEDNIDAIAAQLKESPIENGTRIIVINEDPTHDDAADVLFLGESALGVRFQELLAKWKCKQEDREVCILCPSRKYGTKKMEVKLTPIEPPPVVEPPPPIDGVEQMPPPPPEVFEIVFKDVYTLDTVYRSNEFQRLQTQSEADKSLQEKNNKAKKKNSAAAAKSKRAQKAREEEERLRKEEVAREVAEVKAKQVPDGYIFVCCVTTSIATPEFRATVTNPPRVSVIGDFIGTPEEKEEIFDDLVDGLPTPYDFIQLPEWFRKFSPSLESMFVRDEVLLLMRQNPESRRILDILEEGHFIPQLMAMYEKSRLSELSRPEDLREVDMTIAGVVSMFFRDLVKKMWDQAVPDEVKPHMFNISDEFVMSYCFARALPDPAVAMSSSLEFARAVQYALILSVALRSAQIMSRLDRYAYIIKSPDFATQKVHTMESKEAAIVEEKFSEANRRIAADKAWILADPAAARERDRIAAEAAAEAAALEAALNAINQKNVNLAAEAAEKAAQEMAAMQAEVEKALSVVDINYDSDLDAINNDEVEDLKRQAAATRIEQARQKDVDATMQSVKQFTAERSERVKAGKSTKEIAEQEEEEALGFDLERDGIEKLEQLRSEWLVAAVEVVFEVVVEKEIVLAIAAASGQLLEECYQEAMDIKLGHSEEGRLAHAKLQVQRLRSETAKSRRVYGKRMSFMS